MKIQAIAFTENGGRMACRLRDALTAEGHTIEVSVPQRFAHALDASAYVSLETWTRDAFANADTLLFVSAAGIAVRAIAAHVQDKFRDPAVVCVDEAGRFVVPLLSGHVGGANDLARDVACACGAQPVISTATDVQGLFAIDEWARKQNLAILDREAAKNVSAALLAGQTVGLVSDFPIEGELPSGFSTTSICSVGVCISLDYDKRPFATTLRLAPRSATLGIGCKRATPADQIAQLVDACLAEAHLHPHAITTVASIDAKSNEQGLVQMATQHDWDLRFYTAEELAAVPGEFASSEFVEQTVGVGNVCERAACAAGGTLLLGRRSNNGVTVAIATQEPHLYFENQESLA